MPFLPRACLLLALLALSTPAWAQFSAFGGGSLVPAAGDGGDAVVQGDGLAVYDTTQPGLYASATTNVPEAVLQVDSVRIDGLFHSWGGDLQATLVDPVGTEHLLFVRPGYLNTSSSGTAGNFTGGTYTIVETGGATLPTSSDHVDIPPGTYDQTFTTGGTTWTSGQNGIFNTPLSTIAGPAGVWELRIYDWASGDSGSFTGWTLNGNGYVEDPGMGYCFGDGSGVACPCGGNGAPGGGCLTTSGTGATLVGTGDGVVGNDTFVLSVTGGPPDKTGIFFQGEVQVANPVGDGILCAVSQKRYPVNILDSNGETSRTGFSAFANPGDTKNYQYWFRDPQNPCGGEFNFSNGWVLTWN